MELLESYDSSSSSSSSSSNSDADHGSDQKSSHSQNHGEQQAASPPQTESARRIPGGSKGTTTTTCRHPKRQRTRGSVHISLAKNVPPTYFQRTVAHKRGQWSGHIYLPIRTNSGPAVDRSLRHFQKILEDRGHSGILVQHEEQHISLSRLFTLQLANIEAFVQELSKRLQQVLPPSGSLRLLVDVSQEILLVNDEATRSFWAWPVQASAVLVKIVEQIDSVLFVYNQPAYYKPPTFHISLGSFPGFVEPIYDSECAIGEDEGSDSSESSSDEDSEEDFGTARVDCLVCKFGTTKEFRIPMSQSHKPCR